MVKTHQRKSAVIIGGGFAGLAAALELERRRGGDDFNVTLIDKNCYHLYHALLYEIATASIDITERDLMALQSGVCIRIKALHNIFLKKRIQVLQDAATAIDVARNTIELEQGGRVMYDALIVAVGSQPNDFHIPGLRDHSVSLKELSDALAIHLKIDQLMTTVGRRGAIKIVIGGAGVSGVEVAGELRHYVQRLGRQGRLDPKRFEVHLIEAGPTILSGLSRWTQAQAMKRLRALGVTVHASQPITAVHDHAITFKDGTTHGYHLFVWSGGIQGNKLLTTLGVPLAGKRQIAVTEELSIPGNSEVYVVGDGMFFLDTATSQPVPQIAPAAVAQGRLAATNIIARWRKQPTRAYQPEYPGYVFPIGGRWAISTIGLNLTGFLGWLMRKMVDLRYFLSIVNWRNALSIWYRGGRAYLTND